MENYYVKEFVEYLILLGIATIFVGAFLYIKYKIFKNGQNDR